jgi:aspartate/methionine/tyrosine aminotransferase
MFSSDVKNRARNYLNEISSMGAYTQSKGITSVRQNVAKFISKRDNDPNVDVDGIFLTSGASSAVEVVLRSIIRNERDGIMIPIPQYPLYTATIGLLGGQAIKYYLNEDRLWGLDVLLYHTYH